MYCYVALVKLTVLLKRQCTGVVVKNHKNQAPGNRSNGNCKKKKP